MARAERRGSLGQNKKSTAVEKPVLQRRDATTGKEGSPVPASGAANCRTSNGAEPGSLCLVEANGALSRELTEPELCLRRHRGLPWTLPAGQG